jgi:transposase
MWVMTNNEAIARITLFHYSPRLKSSEADWMLGDFSVALMTDGYAVYDSVCKTKELENLGCWAHTLSYLKEVLDAQGRNKAGKANTALAFIQKLYRIERFIENQTIDKI